MILLTHDLDPPHTCGYPFFQAACAAAMDVEVEFSILPFVPPRLLVKDVAERI